MIVKSKMSFVHQNTAVKKNTFYGSGLYATKGIRRNSLIVAFSGYLVPLCDEVGDSGIQVFDDLVLVNYYKKDPANFINHSCDPNLGLKGQIFLYSLRDIKKNEQLTFDYSTCLFSNSPKSKYVMKCMCGSKNCRKLVSSNDWKIPALQKKYKGYFQSYLQEKINKK
jgi:hypothetical protein